MKYFPKHFYDVTPTLVQITPDCNGQAYQFSVGRQSPIGMSATAVFFAIIEGVQPVDRASIVLCRPTSVGSIVGNRAVGVVHRAV
jgi:hypothetical protein